MMLTEQVLTINTAFKNDVDKGLSSFPKQLSSKYFYDTIGDALFIKIMNMPEYYLTKAEHDIFKNQTQNIIDSWELNTDDYFELIELGAGDGTKTKELLRLLKKETYQFEYIPIDISQNALNNLEKALQDELPKVNVSKKQGDYFKVLKSLKHSNHPKIILFLGSNIGNMSDENAKHFIAALSETLNPNDKILLGVDLIKSKTIVLPAYNDKSGITKAFNLNLLQRINNELDANFNMNTFEHEPEYTEEEGIAKSFLVSTKAQQVTIGAINKVFSFKKGERIHTEISRKYNDQILKTILSGSHLEISKKFTDSRSYFADYILVKK